MNADVKRVLEAVGRVISGKDAVIEKLLMALLAGGHVLMEDIPGTGKTTLAVAVSRALGLECRRIQFTPDVMPSDIVGFTRYDKETDAFVYQPGILLNANLLLGDEINRTSSKTQSALLEAMEEHQVTVDGQTYSLPDPFMVIATENPAGAAGTQLLPQAQLDRFMIRLTLGYPDYDAQMQLLRERLLRDPLKEVPEVLLRETLCGMQADAASITVKDPVLDYITRLALASRSHASVEAGISPRGTLFLCRMARACAYMDDRDYVTGADVQRIFVDVCEHRILLSRRARLDGITRGQVLEELLSTVESADRRLQA
ncbi:MAG: MoxR family ATPase [Clostridia bacterium]|nr:MoxR family ATPase [Clostridia bacterium]